MVRFRINAPPILTYTYCYENAIFISHGSFVFLKTSFKMAVFLFQFLQFVASHSRRFPKLAPSDISQVPASQFYLGVIHIVRTHGGGRGSRKSVCLRTRGEGVLLGQVRTHAKKLLHFFKSFKQNEAA